MKERILDTDKYLYEFVGGKYNGKFYDAAFFANVVDGLGGNVKMYRNPNVLAADVFESENGIAILMPIRP